MGIKNKAYLKLRQWAAIDTLEVRRLLSAFSSLSPTGTLRVVGNDADNVITISQPNSQTIRAKLDNQSMDFAAGSVKRIFAKGLGGKDKLTNLTAIPSTLAGGNGNDTMVGGSGNDVLEGDAGNDAVDYVSRTGTWVFMTPNVYDAEGNGPIDGLASSGNEQDDIKTDVEIYLGTNGYDSFYLHYFGAHKFVCDGRGGNDYFSLGLGEFATVYGGSGNDIFTISEDGSANDRIYGQGGNDEVDLNYYALLPFFDGGSGRDRVDLSISARDLISIAKSPNVEDVIGIGARIGDGTVTVIGNDLNNRIAAAPNTTIPLTLIGGGGNDTLIGGLGNDSLEGDAGFDAVDYSSRTGSWRFATRSSSEELNPVVPDGIGEANSGGEQDAINPDVEKYIGSNQPDNFEVAQNEGHSYVCDGRGGDDSFHLGNSEIATILGGAGNDEFDVTDGGNDDKVYGQAGNDELTLQGRMPFFDGGSGTDVVTVDYDSSQTISIANSPGVENVLIFATGRTIIGNDLDNRIMYDAEARGACTVYGGKGNDVLIGSDTEYDGVPPSDILDGGPGNDLLIGNRGNDALKGGAGNDTLNAGFGSDVLEGDSGFDTADYSDRTSNLSLSLDNLANDGTDDEDVFFEGYEIGPAADNIMADVETVLGGSGADLIIGNPFNNLLVGNGGNDTIFGGRGNDTLVGGPGQDELHGQQDNDLLLAKDGENDFLYGGSGHDTAQRDKSAAVSDDVTNIESFI